MPAPGAGKDDVKQEEAFVHKKAIPPPFEELDQTLGCESVRMFSSYQIDYNVSNDVAIGVIVEDGGLYGAEA